MRNLRILLAAAGLLLSAPLFAQSWCSSGEIAIGDGPAKIGAPYPSSVTVSNAATSVSAISIAINGLTHTFPDDLDLLLVGPGGQKMIIQSDAGGSNDVQGLSYVISDAGAGLMPDSLVLGNDVYRPSQYEGGDVFPSPAPAGPYSEPAPTGSASLASVFGGTNPNGTWSLYVVDDADGDGGRIANWCLRLGAPLKISEFRLRGSSGANDEYIEILNDSPVPTTVSTSDGSTGFAVAASNGVARCVIPNGTVMAAYGHYLCTNSEAYSLSGYPAGVGDAVFSTDIPDNAGIALFRTSLPANFNLANRLDAVGSTSENNTLYKEGAGYPALTPFSIDYAFQRDACGNAGSIATNKTCANVGYVRDSDNNAADFVFVDTNGTSAGAGQRLGAPGPENSSAPRFGTGDIDAGRLDSCARPLVGPNLVLDTTSDPANNATLGRLDVRRTITNRMTVPLTRLRYRIVDLSTFPVPSGTAELRPITSSSVVVTVDRPPCGSGTSNVTVAGTVLEQPPMQPNGGGFNSTFSVNVSGGLAPGASVDVRFVFGLEKTGDYKFALVPEGLPAGGRYTDIIQFYGCTGVDCTGGLFRDGFDY